MMAAVVPGPSIARASSTNTSATFATSCGKLRRVASRWATACARAATPTPTMPPSSPSSTTLGELTRVAWDEGLPGHDRRPRPRADAQDQGQHGEATARSAARRRSTRLGPLVTDIAPGYDHITSAYRRGNDRLVRHGDALLRDAQGASRTCRIATTSRWVSITYKHRGARRRSRQGPSRRRGSRDDAHQSKARFDFRWVDQFNLSLDPDDGARSSTTRRCPRTRTRPRTSARCAGRSSAR